MNLKKYNRNWYIVREFLRKNVTELNVDALLAEYIPICCNVNLPVNTKLK